jgi:putative hydrolase
MPPFGVKPGRCAPCLVQNEGMEARDALTEIAFWLERELAPVFKVKAFRTAAAAIADLSGDELAARARDGRLQNTKGIGDRTFAVIRDALDGGVPEYLEDLREKGAKPLATGGEKLLAALKGDLHSHSEWSDGTTPIGDMVDTARDLGRDYLALTDHSPHLKVANGLTAERLERQLEVVERINADSTGLRLLSGIEVDILDEGELDQSPELLERLDVVVASVHSKLKMDSKLMTARMLAAVRNPHTNVLGHMTGRLVTGSRGTSRNSTRRRCSRRAQRTTSPSRSTRGRNATTRRAGSSARRWMPGASSASTPTPTHRGSSTSSPTAPPGPSRPRCRPTAS